MIYEGYDERRVKSFKQQIIEEFLDEIEKRGYELCKFNSSLGKFADGSIYADRREELIEEFIQKNLDNNHPIL